MDYPSYVWSWLGQQNNNKKKRKSRDESRGESSRKSTNHCNVNGNNSERKWEILKIKRFKYTATSSAKDFSISTNAIHGRSSGQRIKAIIRNRWTSDENMCKIANIIQMGIGCNALKRNSTVNNWIALTCVSLSLPQREQLLEICDAYCFWQS